MSKDLVKYCIKHMSSKELVYALFNDYEIKFKKSDTYEKLVGRLKEQDYENINQEVITRYYRDNWNPTPTQLHLENLRSGILTGHNWHGAMPSMLHLSLQNKVRSHIEGRITLEELVSIGADIMKHEYFMVAVHDLCETKIISTFANVIPPIGHKSITDFIYNDIPYDLKITNYINGYSRDYVNKNKKEVAGELLAGADVERIRKQAKKTINNWGLNRFYFLVEDQDRWINDPEGILIQLVEEMEKLENPFIIKIEEIEIIVQLIAI